MIQGLIPGALLLTILLTLTQCSGQEGRATAKTNTSRPDQPIVGGGCDGCELMFDNMPKSLTSSDTTDAWFAANPKFILRGKMLRLDGRTPAAGVVLYFWHTDAMGIYPAASAQDGKRNPHGQLHGWVQTGNDGSYAIYTLRPGPYPGGGNPAHIHFAVKEPAIANAYYIDDVVFEGDPYLTDAVKNGMQNRGGSGVLKVVANGNTQTATRDIVLGKNIPNYPVSQR